MELSQARDQYRAERPGAKILTSSLCTHALPQRQLDRCVTPVAADVVSGRDEEQATEVWYAHFFLTPHPPDCFSFLKCVVFRPNRFQSSPGATTGFIQLFPPTYAVALPITCKQTLMSLSLTSEKNNPYRFKALLRRTTSSV